MSRQRFAHVTTRRGVLQGVTVLSAGAVALLAGRPATAAKMSKGGDSARDVPTLNTALALEKSLAEYAKQLDVARLKTQADVLDFAAGLEKTAVNAYLGIIPAFSDLQWAKLAGQLATDEREHFTVLTQALGRPLPAPLGFGA